MVHPRLRRWARILLSCMILASGGALVACGDHTENASPRAGQPRTEQPGTSRTTYPLTITNCGRAVTFKKAPERVVTYYQTTFETLVALGLQDRIVGRAKFEESPLLPEQKQAYESVPQLFDGLAPTKEVLLSARPDMIFASYPPSDFDRSKGYPTRDELDGLGIASYAMSSQCDKNTKASLEKMAADIETLGKIFDIQDRAQQLLQRLRSQVEEVERKVAGQPAVPVVAYINGEGPLLIYGSALVSGLIASAGGRNIFADEAVATRIGVEKIAQAQPEVWITINSQPGPTAEQKATLLLKTFPNAPASRERRVIALENVDVSPGLRIFTTVATLAKGLHPGAMK